METQVIEREEVTDEPLPPLPRLENWRHTTRREAGQYNDDPCLAGNVYGHPHFPDGFAIWTSRLVWINLPSRLAQTQSRLYQLGKKES